MLINKDSFLYSSFTFNIMSANISLTILFKFGQFDKLYIIF